MRDSIHDTETDELIDTLATTERDVHDTDTDELIAEPSFSKAVTRELDDGVPIMPADETPTLKIIRITDQSLIDDFEQGQKTVVPTGEDPDSDREDWQNTFGDA